MKTDEEMLLLLKTNPSAWASEVDRPTRERARERALVEPLPVVAYSEEQRRADQDATIMRVLTMLARWFGDGEVNEGLPDESADLIRTASENLGDVVADTILECGEPLVKRIKALEARAVDPVVIAELRDRVAALEKKLKKKT